MISRLRRVGSKIAYRLQNLVDSDFEPVFICGVAGSGTTLLTGLLHQRYQIAVNARESARWAPEGSVLHIKPIAEYPNIANYFEHLFFAQEATPRQVQRESIQLYRSLARWPKLSDAVLDKAPNTHLARAGMLHAAFPDSKFLLIVRDPVSSIEGLRRKWPLFGKAELAEVCKFWSDVHRIFQGDTLLFQDKVKVTTYERLVKNTDAVVADFAAFLNLNERGDLLAYQDIDSAPGKGLRNVKQGEIQIDRSANTAAADRVSVDEVDVIRRTCGALYEELSAA